MQSSKIDKAKPWKPWQADEVLLLFEILADNSIKNIVKETGLPIHWVHQIIDARYGKVKTI